MGRVWQLVVRLRGSGVIVDHRAYRGPFAVALAVNAASAATDGMDVVCALTSYVVK